MQYNDFLLKLYASPPTPGTPQSTTHYQAQVLTPVSAGGGRFNILLGDADLETLQRPLDALREFARYGPAGWDDLEYQQVEDAVRAVAHKLQASLPADLQQTLGQAIATARTHGRGLRIGFLVESRSETLAVLPWEMLSAPTWPGGYLALSAYSPVVRLVETAMPPRPWGSRLRRPLRSNSGQRLVLGFPQSGRPLRRVLVVVAGAHPGQAVAGAEAEARMMQEILTAGGTTEVHTLWPPVSFARFAAELDTQPYDLVHIITHGGVDLASDLAYLLFDTTDEASDLHTDPAPQQLIATRLATVLAGQPELELLVLSACRSADPRAPRPDPDGSGVYLPGGLLTASLAPQLAATAGIAVLAMQFDILAPAAAANGDPARGWAAAFYRHLHGQTGVESALAAARRALAVDKEPVLWAAPVLYVPLYWVPAPPPLYHYLDRYLYQGLATLQESNGLLIPEGLFLLGLLLTAGLLSEGLFNLPANPADHPALAGAAISLLLLTIGFPFLIAAGVLLLEAQRRQVMRRFRPIALLLAYGGAGFGILTALAAVGALALVAHAAGLLTPFVAASLRVLGLLGTVGMGLVYAGRFVGVYDSVTDTPRVRRGDWVIGLGAVIGGGAVALCLLLFYDLLLDPHTGIALLATACLGLAVLALQAVPGARP